MSEQAERSALLRPGVVFVMIGVALTLVGLAAVGWSALAFGGVCLLGAVAKRGGHV